MLFKAFSPDAEVSGSNIKMYISSMGAFTLIGKTILRSCGIEEEPKANCWYNHQMFLNAVREIEAKTGPNTIALIGSRVAENAIFPPDVNSMEKALENLGEAYQVNHRGDNKSFKRSLKIADHTYKVIAETPYPCDLDAGYLMGLANRYGINAIITHDDSQPCRKHGAESCTYNIVW
jgi:hypothetical protein